MRLSFRDIVLRGHVDVPGDLMDRVASGLVDIAIMYAPQHRPGLNVDLLMEEKLVHVTTDPDGRLLDDRDYVYVDWGPDFLRHHGRSEEHTSELQSLMRISYAVFCLKKKKTNTNNIKTETQI